MVRCGASINPTAESRSRSFGPTSLSHTAEKLTFKYAGRDFRLTDVHGNVVKEILA